MNHRWIVIAKASDVEEGAPFLSQRGADPVCLFRLNGRVYATQDKCTHGEASLSEGYVEGEEVECPFHQGLFHIPSGKATGAPCTIDLQVFEVKEEGGEILLKV